MNVKRKPDCGRSNPPPDSDAALEHLEKILKLCRDYGVHQLSLGDTHVELAPPRPAAQAPQRPMTDAEKRRQWDATMYHSS